MANGLGITNDGVSYLECTPMPEGIEEAYALALAEHTAAFQAFDLIRNAYRNYALAPKNAPTDEEYIAARRIYDAATAKFDEAYAIRAGWK